MVRGLIGWRGGGGRGGKRGRRQITATELLPTAQKNKRYAKFVFFIGLVVSSR